MHGQIAMFPLDHCSLHCTGWTLQLQWVARMSATWCSETVLTTGSIIPLSRDVTMILYGLSHRGTCSWCHIDCNSQLSNNFALFNSLHTATSQALSAAASLSATVDKEQTCSCCSTWKASSSCRRSSPHFTMTGTRRHADKWPYGDDSRILCTFSSQGSLSAAADGSSGSCYEHKYTSHCQNVSYTTLQTSFQHSSAMPH